MNRYLNIAAVGLTSLFLLGLAAASILGLLDPQNASVSFGMPVSDAAGALFYRVFASRNLVIVASCLAFLVSRQWKPLAIVVTLTSALAAFDMTVLTFDGRSPPTFHSVTLVLIIVTSALLWRRATIGKP